MAEEIREQRKVMYDICINVRPPTEIGRIHYFHDPEIFESILFLTSSVSRFNIWNINFRGGLAIIDFDKNRLLKDVECIYPRSAWKKSQSLFIPKPELHGNIELTDVKSDQGSLIQPYATKRMGQYFMGYWDEDTEVEILIDNSFSIAWILLGNHDSSGDWVGLSDRCSALIRDNKLLGFSVNLANAPLRKFQKSDSYQAAQ